MAETAASRDDRIAFDVVKQHVVWPDRYYRVELRRGVLHFSRTGTQFDLAHAGSVGRDKMKHAPTTEPPALQRLLGKASRGQLLGVGAGLVSVSSVLIVGALTYGWIIGYLWLALIVGFILLLAGFVTPTAAQSRSGTHNFSLPLSRIQVAKLHMPKEAGKVARLEVQPLADRAMNLTINTPADVATVRESLLPMLGRKGRVA